MTPAMTSPALPGRIRSVDIIRGAVIVLMAIDHVRVYAGLPAGGPTAAIFFTRWITHFCAPAFVFLAGTGAWFYGRRHPDLRRFLCTRGLWLILLELTVLRVAWTFNVDFAHYNMAGVIWVIGWSMILLAALVRLPLAVIGGLGVLVMGGHHLIPRSFDDVSALRNVLQVGFFAGPIGGNGTPPLIVLYTIVPWVGVMAAGYAFGGILALEPARRDRLCLAIGLGAVALFLVLRGFNLYGNPYPWSASGNMPALLSFLDTAKYPASLQFLLMTLGPTIAFIPLLERATGVLARPLEIFGRVPFFFYVLHIPLIHAFALVVSKLRLGSVSPWLFANHPMGAPPPPDGYAWSLPLLYLVWAVAIAILYTACRWYAAVKAGSTSPWLKYL